MDRVDELREKLPVECEFPEGCQDLLDDLLELARLQREKDHAWDAVIRRIGPSSDPGDYIFRETLVRVDEEDLREIGFMASNGEAVLP